MSDGKIIIDTSLDTKGVEKGLTKLKGIATTGAKATIGALGGISVALGGVAAYAIKVGSDFEEAMSKVEAISGASKSDMQLLADKAKEMGATTKFSATESAEALQYMAMAGWKTQQMMDGLPGIMNLAAASGEDLAMTSDIVTDALTAFGMKASESAHFADVLAQASNASNTNVAMLGESFKYVAPLCGSLGYSAEDTSIALGIMANSGIKASQAGTTLKTALVNMAKPTKKMSKVMDEYNLSLTNSDGSMKSLKEVMDELRTKMGGLDKATQASAAATLFGKESLAGMLAIINAAPEDYAKLTDAIYNANGAAEKMAQTMNDNLKGQIVLLKSAVEGLGIELYESVDNPLKEVVKTANTMVSELSKAFKENGMQGLVEQLGTCLSEVVLEIANATPQVINASTNLILAFISGISNNVDKITESGARIANALVKGVIKILPAIGKLGLKITEELVKNLFGDAVGNKVKLLTGDIKKCFKDIADTIKSLVQISITTLGNLIRVFSNIARTVLPMVTSAIKFLGNNIKILLPLITMVVVGMKAWAIVQSVTTLINNLRTSMAATRTAIEAFTVAQAAATAGQVANTTALTLSQIAVGALTGKIGLATAAQQLWNLVMAANPIGLVITAVAALAAGIGILCMMQENEYSNTERLKDANELLGQSYGEVGEAAVKFQNGIESAKGIFDGFNDSIIVSNEEQQKLSSRMDEVQGQITEIAKTATNERRNLTQSEIDRLNNLFEEMQKLAQRELEIQQTYATTVQERAKVLADTHQGTLEEYQTYSQNLIKSAEDTRAQVIAKANEQCTEEIALLTEKYRALGQLGSDDYNREVKTANDKYTNAVNSANKQCGDTLAIIQQGYADRAGELRKYIDNTKGLNAQEEAENKRYNQAIEEENERHNTRIATSEGNQLAADSVHKANMKKLEEEHNGNLAKLREENNKNLSEKAKEQMGVYITMATDTELYGGKVEGKTKEITDGIIRNFDKLPPETQKAMANAMKPMLEEMNKSEPGLFEKATNIAKGILTRLRKAFDIHSPSRETRKIFKYVMEGAKLGLEDGEADIYNTTDRISKNVIQKMSTDIIDNARKEGKSYKDIGSYYVEQLKQGIEARENEALKSAEKIINDQVAALVKTNALEEKALLKYDENLIKSKLKTEKALYKINRSMSKSEKARLGDLNDRIKEENKKIKEYNATIIKGEKDRIAKQNETIKAANAKIKETNDLMKSTFTNSGKEVSEAYKEALKSGMDKVQEELSSRIKSITEEFQKQYDSIIQLRDSMENKLSGFGDLFTIEDGYITVNDINKQIDAIEKYSTLMEELKNKGVSQEFLDKVASLGIEEGSKYVEALLKMDEQQFDNYINAWEEKQKLAKEVAAKFYKDQLDTIDKNFKDKIDETLNDIPNIVDTIGQQTIMGFIDGLNKEQDALKNKLLQIAFMVTDTLRSALDIHSPSRKTRDLIGRNIIKGVGVGIDLEAPKLSQQVKSTISDLVAKMKFAVSTENANLGSKLLGGISGNRHNSNQIITNDNGITQSITIVNPERTPSENARLIKKAGRDLLYAR